MIGDGQVGKTSLVSQFLTSEHMYSYDASLDDEYGEKSLSVKLDGEEVELCFIDLVHLRHGSLVFADVGDSNQGMFSVVVLLSVCLSLH